jgi:DNA-binding transcriptional MerR regulator
VRFYEEKGLLNPRRAGTTRIYTHRDRARLRIILRGKNLGFSLASIKDYLDLYDADPDRKEQALLLLDGVRRKIRQLQNQRRDLDMTLNELREIEQQTLEALGQASATRPNTG